MKQIGRPKRKSIDITEDSMIDLMQETYNEITDERNRAIKSLNQYSRDIETNEDIALVGRVTNDLLKIIDRSIERKLQLIKIQGDILFKNGKGSNPAGGPIKITDEDKQMIQEYLKNNSAANTKTYDD